MGLLGSAIGAGLGAVGGIFGGISASKAMRNVKNNLNAQRRTNQDWYDRRYNEDATQRADAQAMLTRVEESILNRNRQAAGTQAVMGGSGESAAAAKAAANIVVNGERRKDAIEAQYQAKDEALQQQLNDMEINKASNTAQAIQGVAQAGANIAGLF